MKEPFLKIERFNGHEQIFQVTWPKTWPEHIFFQVTCPRTWEEQTFHVPSPRLDQNRFFPSDMASDLEGANFPCTWPRTWLEQISQVTWPKDLKRANFPCIWPKTWPRTNFLNIWLINWPRAKVPKYDQETSQKKKFMDTSNSTSQ